VATALLLLSKAAGGAFGVRFGFRDGMVGWVAFVAAVEAGFRVIGGVVVARAFSSSSCSPVVVVVVVVVLVVVVVASGVFRAGQLGAVRSEIECHVLGCGRRLGTRSGHGWILRRRRGGSRLVYTYRVTVISMGLGTLIGCPWRHGGRTIRRSGMARLAREGIAIWRSTHIFIPTTSRISGIPVATGCERSSSREAARG
jgi:hypothetical protein